MRVTEIDGANRWPEWTNETLVVEGTDDPVFVRPVLRTNDGVRSHWVDLRIGARGYPGAKYCDYAPAYAKEKADELRADAERAESSGGTVQFVIHPGKTSRRTTLTPAQAQQVEQAIDEALRLLENLPAGEAADGRAGVLRGRSNGRRDRSGRLATDGRAGALGSGEDSDSYEALFAAPTGRHDRGR